MAANLNLAGTKVGVSPIGPKPIKAQPIIGSVFPLTKGMANTSKTLGSIPQFHKGGKVKKSGIAMLKKGEVVRTKEQEKDIQDKIKKVQPKSLMTKEEPLTPVSIHHNSMPVAYFVRHGTTDMNDDDKFRGDLDVPLNEDGAKQAQQLVSYFHNVTPSAIYHSTRARTLQTIGPLAKNKKIKPELLADLDSLNTGNFAGKPKDKKNEEQMQWYREHPDSKIPGGDVIREWQNRVDKGLSKVINKGVESGNPSIAVIHGSVVKELSRFLHGDIHKTKVEPGGVVAVFKLPSGGFIAEPILKENSTDEEKLHVDS